MTARYLSAHLLNTSKPDKHGQLGIWDARAPNDEDDDEDGSSAETREGGKYWRLQMHWPATAKSSISCIKFDPINANSASQDHPLIRRAERSSSFATVVH